MTFNPDATYPQKYTIANPNIILSVATNDILMEGTYTIAITLVHTVVANTPSPAPLAPISFTLIVIDNPCAGGIAIPAPNALDHHVSWSTGANQVVPLPGILNGECNFDVTMAVTSGLTAPEEAAVIISTTQPTFTSVPAAIDVRILSLTTDGFITINTSSLTTRADIAITLTVNSRKNIHDTVTSATNFIVQTSYCPSVFSSAVSGDYKLISYLRNDKTALITLDAQDTTACTRTKFEATFNGSVIASNAPYPDWFSFEVNEVDGSPSQGTLSNIWSEDQAAIARHTIKAKEYYWDDRTNYFEQDIQVDILDPCILSTIGVPSYSFDATYVDATRTIKVSWYPFKVTPDDGKYC